MQYNRDFHVDVFSLWVSFNKKLCFQLCDKSEVIRHYTCLMK